MKTNSLSFRLLFSSGLLLTAFFVLVAFFLEQGFRETAERALKEKLQVHIYSLISAAELTERLELSMPASLREPRFANPGSGLYASITQINNMFVWRSPSAIGMDFSSPVDLPAGQSVFVKNEQGLFVLHYAVIWENKSGFEQYYIFSVAEDRSSVMNQLERFRLTLRTWLFFSGLLLVVIQFLVLRWNLRPLRVIVHDLEDIEIGRKSRLDGIYPQELQGLAGNLNALVSSERAHLERYRNTLADLAHSLKTPLAILRGSVEVETVNKTLVTEQISRMNEIVEYQLQKAAAKGQKKILGQVDLAELVEKIIFSLQKVYADKQIEFSYIHDENCFMYCEQGDIYEIVGNLMDNASKWCQKNVRVHLTQYKRQDDGDFSVLIQIEDDGPGIPAEKLQDILQRGVRADENIDGHGIGMAVVNELTLLLGGKLLASKSEGLGGMQWQVYLP